MPHNFKYIEINQPTKKLMEKNEKLWWKKKPYEIIINATG